MVQTIISRRTSVAGIRSKWDKLLKKKKLQSGPPKNVSEDYTIDSMPLTLIYIPERANRPSGAGSSFLDDLKSNSTLIYDFGELALLANARPILRYHCLLCTRDYVPQNGFNSSHIKKVTELLEQYELRGFLNLVGSGASIDHFHVQVVLDRFNVEQLYSEGSTELPHYPAKHVILSGKDRCDDLEHEIAKWEKSGVSPTLDKDERPCEKPLYTLLFWEDKVMFIPRSKESYKPWGRKIGGLEMSGSIAIERLNGNYSLDEVMRMMKNVGYNQNGTC